MEYNVKQLAERQVNETETPPPSIRTSGIISQAIEAMYGIPRRQHNRANSFSQEGDLFFSRRSVRSFRRTVRLERRVDLWCLITRSGYRNQFLGRLTPPSCRKGNISHQVRTGEKLYVLRSHRQIFQTHGLGPCERFSLQQPVSIRECRCFITALLTYQ